MWTADSPATFEVAAHSESPEATNHPVVASAGVPAPSSRSLLPGTQAGELVCIEQWQLHFGPLGAATLMAYIRPADAAPRAISISFTAADVCQELRRLSMLRGPDCAKWLKKIGEDPSVCRGDADLTAACRAATEAAKAANAAQPQLLSGNGKLIP